MDMLPPRVPEAGGRGHTSWSCVQNIISQSPLQAVLHGCLHHPLSCPLPVSITKAPVDPVQFFLTQHPSEPKSPGTCLSLKSDDLSCIILMCPRDARSPCAVPETTLRGVCRKGVTEGLGMHKVTWAGGAGPQCGFGTGPHTAELELHL